MARQKYAIMNQKSLTSPVADTDLMDASALSLKTVHRTVFVCDGRLRFHLDTVAFESLLACCIIV